MRNEVKTQRLRIVPLTTAQMEALAKHSQTDNHMEAAIREMYNGCVAHPNDRLWYTNWQIQLRSNGTSVGSLCFKGAPKNGAVEIGYGIDKPFQKQGYATEAVKGVMEWAFAQQGVYFVTAETEKENLASIQVLENNGFSYAGEGAEGPRWEKENPASDGLGKKDWS